MSNDQAIARQAPSPIALGSRGVELHSLEDLYRFAVAVSSTVFAPKDFKTPESIMIAVQYGAEVGLSPMASLRGVAVVNGKPSLYGDALMAVVRASGQLEEFSEGIVTRGDGLAAVCNCGEFAIMRECIHASVAGPLLARPDETVVAVCHVKRRGMPTARNAVFGSTEARLAGLWRKAGPWTTYPDRMCSMRARGFALRDEFADYLGGFISIDEAMDYPPPKEKNVTPPKPETTAEPPAPTRKNEATREQLDAILAEAARAGVVAEEAAMELLGFGFESLQSGSAQRLYGHLRTLPDAIDAEEPPAPDSAPTAESADPVDAAIATMEADRAVLSPEARREADGRAIAARGEVAHDAKARCFRVKSGKDKEYKVTRPNGHMACTCPDWTYNRAGDDYYRCEHIWSVAYFVKGDDTPPFIAEREAADLRSAFSERGVDSAAWLKQHGIASGRCEDCTAEVYNRAMADLFN